MTARAWRRALLASMALTAAVQGAVRRGPTGAAVRACVGVRRLRAGDAQGAVEALEAIGTRYRTPARWYHLGTALLEAGMFARAAEALTASLVEGASPDLRQRTLHNLALARYRLAEREEPGASAAAARAAVAVGREALRLDPDADDTRRNLVLAQRLLQRVQPRRDTPPSDGGVRPGVPGTSTGSGHGGGVDSGPFTPAEAARILDALRSVEGIALDRELAGRMGASVQDAPSGGPPW